MALDRETAALIGQTLDRFVRDEAGLIRRRERLEQQGDERLHWPLLAELGVLAIPVREDFGGIGGGAADIGDACRILGRGLVLEPVIEGAFLPAALMQQAGDAGGLDQLVCGTAMVTAGGRAGDRISAVRSGDGVILSGHALTTPSVPGSEQILVIASCGDAGPVIARVATADVAVTPYTLMDGRQAADVQFADLAVGADAIIASGKDAQQCVEALRVAAVAAYLSDAVGVMEQLVLDTGDYLRTRKQFGVVIGTFQALQHRFADMHADWLETVAMVSHLNSKLANNSDEALMVAGQAAWIVERAASRIGHEAIQMHGGMGATEELAISHLNARLVVLTRLVRGWLPQSRALALSENVAGEFA